ncbi:hypothetical protein T03_13981 [Trichinella britovi]|uniref:Uncharacterized protein n=1 Tax=Trichinella britovi TaxID=45882 RepID=A0A0V1AMM4_TRIBR|nr:hypothetical protein T03_13981 [Trichinella britovi]
MSNCFKKDVTKLQAIKLKIDRMRRKENPMGWALPQQSIKGLILQAEQLVLVFVDAASDCVGKKSMHYKSKYSSSRDFESIVKFRLWRAFECINCLLKTFSSDEDMVNAIQLKNLKFYATQAEMLKVHFPINLSGVDSLNAPLYEKNSFITVGIVDMFV